MEEDLVQNMEDEDDEDEDERVFEWDAGDEEDADFDWLQEEQEEAFASRASPAERSGHIAVTDGCCMFVWGGYKVRHPSHKTFLLLLLCTDNFIILSECRCRSY